MSQPLVGAPRSRTDGPAKAGGANRYTADNALPRMVHAVVVPSTIASGRIRSIDDRAARAASGVIAVMTPSNAPRVNPQKRTEQDAVLFLLQDDVVQFDRQPVAVVIANTFEQATHAAELVRVDYDVRPPVMELRAGERYEPKQVLGEPANHRRGDPSGAFAAAPVTVKQTYRTPTEHHNPMETHATIATWNDGRLTLFDATQWPFGVRQRLAAVFSTAPEAIEVRAPFVGGAFGGKGTTWSHVALAAMAAKLVNRPVRLVVTRPQMFGWVGHRPQTEQVVAIGADRDGRLRSVSHDVVSETSLADEFVEACAVFSRDLYAVPNYEMSQTLRRLTISKPTFQRAPGESTGSFAMESAMDELAYATGIDPLELRLRNYAETDPNNGKQYSSKRLRDCYRLAAERFGWSRRSAKPRTMTNGRMLVGWGMATASRGNHRSPTSARITMRPDGTVLVQCGTIEQGTGSSTVYAQLAAEILELPYERVTFVWGDTSLPDAPIAAGSQTAASVGSAVAVAAQRLRERLAALGRNAPTAPIVIEVRDAPGPEEEKFALQAFGAHFAEVQVDPDLPMVSVTRWVGAFDGGRILNEKTARSQYLGGIVWGISMALFEETRYDRRTGRIMNPTLEKYLVPTHADIPNPEIIIVPSDDPHANPARVKGIGEVGMTGAAAAVANAVYHATGVRVRDLPITPDKLL